MKKTILFAAAAALILASCGKNEVFVPVQEDIPVGFSNYAPRAISKANGSLVNSGALPTGSQIGVFGYSTETDNLKSNFTTKPIFMTDAKVDYGSNTSATATATNPVRYWPKTITNLLSFYAYYPRESARIEGKPTASTEGMGTFTFTQAGTVADMEDFMISNVANDQYYWKDAEPAEPTNDKGVKAVNGVVPLVFNHMLTKVNFKFRTVSNYGNDIKITVKSAKIAKETLSKVVITPSYTAGAAGALGTTAFAYSSNTAYGADIVIPFSEGDNTVDPAIPAGQILTTDAELNNGTAVTQTDFLFVPQTISNDVKVTITYDIDQNGSVTENTATVQLNKVKNGSDAFITEWGINDFVTYIFSIGLKEIKFTGTATNWDAEIEGNYVIE
ncbi:MAG: fimbrillin family protein [Bacteroidales bacterium]|nr:fimbrillin family protein [Bacteroidales bacterium]